MIRTQVSLDEEMYRRARAEARRQRVSFAELCRRALARLLAGSPVGDGPGAADERPWMRLAGSLSSGDGSASRSVDAVVYGRPEP